MAKRNKDTTPETPPGFEVKDAPEYQGAGGSTDADDDGLDDVDDIEDYPTAVGVQPVMLAQLKVKEQRYFTFEFQFEATEFESAPTLRVKLDKREREDHAKIKQFVFALGSGWKNGRPDIEGGWRGLNGRRARAVVGAWEKGPGDVVDQIPRFGPSFSDTDQGHALRDAFQASCDAQGIACEFKPNTGNNVNYRGNWDAHGKLLRGCGLLPVAE